MELFLLGLIAVALAAKAAAMTSSRIRRARMQRGSGWVGYVVVDNDSLFRSPTLRYSAYREGRVAPVFGTTPRPGGVVTGRLHVSHGVFHFQPGRLSRGSGARAFRLTPDQVQDLRVVNDRIAVHLRGDPEPINIAGDDAAGLAEAATRFRYQAPPHPQG